MRQIIAISLSVFLGSANVFGWGPEGHAIIAAVAEARLTNATRDTALALLGNQTLASIASWADEVRAQRDYTYNWHFVDIPKSSIAFLESRDCFLPTDKHQGAATDHQNCVVDRITLFEQALATAGGNREEALKFLVHFVGDVHQPFHSIGDAAGGNTIRISLFGSTNCPFRGKNAPCNLHSAWDDGLIEHTGRSQSQYVTFIQSLIAQQHLDANQPGQPADWANAAHKLAQAAWVNQGGSIDQTYFNAQINAVNTQLALAAIRLANAIEQTLGANPGAR
jgi:hypothetical protein